MKWVGITGGMACGKSTVSHILRQKGYTVIEADQVAHLALKKDSPTYLSLVQYFGTGILGVDGAISRTLLAKEVFQDKEKLSFLESIVHPFVRNYVLKKRNERALKNETLAFYEVPLLFEKHMESQFDIILAVSCSEEVQLKRLREERGLSLEESQTRLKHFLPQKEKEKKSNYVIYNNKDLEELERQVNQFIEFCHSPTPS